MPRPQTVNLATMTPYVRKYVPKRVYKKKVTAMRPGGYAPGYREAGELMSLDTNDAPILNSTGKVQCLNLVAQGDDINQRHGRQITLKSVSIKGYIKPNGVPTSEANICNNRLVLVWDKTPNGVLPTPASILDAANGHPLLDNRNRFTILKDWYLPNHTTSCNANEWTWSQPFLTIINFYKKLNLKTIYKGTDATIGSISTGALYLLSWNTTPTGNVGTGIGQTACRVRYTDK